LTSAARLPGGAGGKQRPSTETIAIFDAKLEPESFDAVTVNTYPSLPTPLAVTLVVVVVVTAAGGGQGPVT
jgi:hypothetical protein